MADPITHRVADHCGEDRSDFPRGMSEVLCLFASMVDDALPEAERSRFDPLVPRFAQTGGTGVAQRNREALRRLALTDFAVRMFLPVACHRFQRAALVPEITGIATIRGASGADHARGTLLLLAEKEPHAQMRHYLLGVADGCGTAVMPGSRHDLSLAVGRLFDPLNLAFEDRAASSIACRVAFQAMTAMIDPQATRRGWISMETPTHEPRP